MIISEFETVTDRGLNFTENYLGRGDLSVTSISGRYVKVLIRIRIVERTREHK